MFNLWILSLINLRWWGLKGKIPRFKKMKLNTLSRLVTVALWRVNRNFSLELQISSYMYILNVDEGADNQRQ